MSAQAYSSCELDEYTKYLNAQNESFSEAATEMSKKDELNYGLVKEFISLHIQANNLKSYTAKKLVSVNSDLVDKSGNIASFIRQQFSELPDGSVVSTEEQVMSNDPIYIKTKQTLAYFNRFYIFGFKLEGSEKEKWEEFSKAREVFGTYLENTKSMPYVEAAFEKNFSEVCKL